MRIESKKSLGLKDKKIKVGELTKHPDGYRFQSGGKNPYIESLKESSAIRIFGQDVISQLSEKKSGRPKSGK